MLYKYNCIEINIYKTVSMYSNIDLNDIPDLPVQTTSELCLYAEYNTTIESGSRSAPKSIKFLQGLNNYIKPINFPLAKFVARILCLYISSRLELIRFLISECPDGSHGYPLQTKGRSLERSKFPDIFQVVALLPTKASVI